jgi:hypothetical protein
MAPNSNDVTPNIPEIDSSGGGLVSRRSMGNNFVDNAIQMRGIIN